MATIKHIFTNPKADGADPTIVRPSDWNSAHAITMIEGVSLSGNTDGVLANITSGTFYLAGGNNITLSQNANSVSIIGGAGGAGNTGYLSAGTQTGSLGTISFADSNGVSFGMDAQTITATVKTDYLTTAMASNRGSDFVQATAAFAGTNAVGTIASAGISVSASDQTSAMTDLYLDNAQLAAMPGDYIFAGSNITISESPTADAISIFAPDTTQFLTTAMASNRGSDFVAASAAFAGTSASGTIASNGISVSIGPYITTAMASDAGSRFVNTSAGLNLTSISATFNSNSISLSVGPYLTTAMASNRGTDFVQATATIAGTNISGTIASNVISLSVAAPGAAAENNWITLLGANVSSNSSASGSTIGWSGSNITLAGTNNSQVIISAPATSSLVGTSGISLSTNGSTISIYQPVVSEFEPFKVAPVTNSTLGQSTLYFVPFDVNDMVSASRVNFFHSIAFTYSGAPNNSTAWLAAGYGLYTRMTDSTDRISLLTSYSMRYLSGSVSSSTRLSMTNYWQLSNGTSHSTTQFGVNNVTAGTYLTSSIGGYRVLAFPVSQLLTPGRYWMGYSIQSASQGNSFVLNHSVAQAQFSNQLAWRPFNVTSQASDASFWQASAGAGVYSAASAAWPNSIPLTSDSIRALTAHTIPIFNFSGISQSSNLI